MIFQTAGTTTCDEIDFLNLDFEYDENGDFDWDPAALGLLDDDILNASPEHQHEIAVTLLDEERGQQVFYSFSINNL